MRPLPSECKRDEVRYVYDDRSVYGIFQLRDLNAEDARELSFGRKISASPSAGIYAAISSSNELIALLENQDDGAKPIAVFAPAK